MSPDSSDRRQGNAEIISRLDDVRRVQDLMLVKLFGELEGENEQGRLPRIEETIKRHGGRITRLEKWGLLAIGGGLVAWKIAESVFAAVVR